MAFPSTPYVTASHTSVGSLTDPSPYVDLSLLGAEFWALVDTSDGTKGRVFKEDETELAVVWLSFDNGAETGELRFKWSGTWSAAGANTIRIYPPLAARASVGAGDTFGSFNAFDDDWAAYYPMNDASGGIADRTSNGADLAEVGTPTYGVPGQVGDAITLGAGDYFESVVATVTNTPMTIMAWGKADDVANAYTLGSVADASTENNYFNIQMRGNSGGDPVAAFQFGSNQLRGAFSTSGFSVDVWHHVVGRLVSTLSRFVYLDGANEGFNGQSTGATTGIDTTSVGITGDSTPDGDFKGSLQELQFHSVDRGVDWIAEEFAATKNPGTYWGVWTFVAAEEDVDFSGTAAITTTATATLTGTTGFSGTAAAATTMSAILSAAIFTGDVVSFTVGVKRVQSDLVEVNQVVAEKVTVNQIVSETVGV